jgi:hypothetical protein
MVEEDYINRTIDIPASQTTEALKQIGWVTTSM